MEELLLGALHELYTDARYLQKWNAEQLNEQVNIMLEDDVAVWVPKLAAKLLEKGVQLPLTPVEQLSDQQIWEDYNNPAIGNRHQELKNEWYNRLSQDRWTYPKLPQP